MNVSDCTDFITFTKPFCLPHTQCKEIKHNIKKNMSLLFTIKRVCCIPAGLGVLYNREHIMAQVDQRTILILIH